MNWSEQLGKDKQGSRPRCVLLTDGCADEVAERLTALVDHPDVVVSPGDNWMPCGKPIRKEDGSWDKTSADEVQLHKANCLVCSKVRKQIGEWWFAVQTTGPNWDIASTCTIKGKSGLLLVEAKAHVNELSAVGKTAPNSKSQNSRKNHEHIGKAITEANRYLRLETGNNWNLCRDRYYQLSNRFAWSWKLVTLGVPVVLMYLGFLNARDMVGEKLFLSTEEWDSTIKTHGESVVDNTCWNQWLNISGTPLLPLIRASDLQFYP